jgi:hypothetical protein
MKHQTDMQDIGNQHRIKKLRLIVQIRGVLHKKSGVLTSRTVFLPSNLALENARKSNGRSEHFYPNGVAHYNE